MVMLMYVYWAISRL